MLLASLGTVIKFCYPFNLYGISQLQMGNGSLSVRLIKNQAVSLDRHIEIKIVFIMQCVENVSYDELILTKALSVGCTKFSSKKSDAK